MPQAGTTRDVFATEQETRRVPKLLITSALEEIIVAINPSNDLPGGLAWFDERSTIFYSVCCMYDR